VTAERRALWRIAGAALAIRLVLMLARGDYIVYDEGYYLLLARSLRAGHGFALNGLPHVALSPLQPVLVALLSAVGIPDLWASRLLAVVCGALLVFPVAALARRAGGERAATVAAGLTAASPALMSFVPFFPGQSWNLYFGSEPLFLLLAFGAVAAAMRVDEGRLRWWIATGALAAGAYLTRAEGVVLGPVLFLLLAVRVVARRGGPRAWRGFALAALGALVVAAPYLWYLHSTLGRWALSGRVQAAAAAGPAAPSAVQSGRSAGEILDAFVWQGRPEAFLRAMYGLDPTGTRMTSQYWGVHRAPAAHSAAPPATAPESAAAPARGAPPTVPGSAGLAAWWRGLGAVVPWWLGVLALGGLVLARRESLLWALPLGVAAVLPSWLTYVEPRSLLPLAPLAAAFASLTVGWIAAGTPARWRPAALLAIPALTALALVTPALRDLARAWSQQTALQQVATARRTIGEYLAAHLPPGDAVMSLHPAIAIWARHPWRVMPYDSFERIVAYAERERVSAMVFSRFEPSPLPRPPRAFTIILPAAGAAVATGSTVLVTPVEETPLFFVGRLSAARAAR
jgi:4-amino-4-deoxy-L-arabinose transferase-like glycosyltransferase